MSATENSGMNFEVITIVQQEEARELKNIFESWWTRVGGEPLTLEALNAMNPRPPAVEVEYPSAFDG